jgi:hypothetical protein
MSHMDEPARLHRRALRLAHASMGWMVIEAGIAVTAGVLAASIALIGFGLDSVIEFFSALIVVWQLHGQGEERETRAVRLIAGRSSLSPPTSLPRASGPWSIRLGPDTPRQGSPSQPQHWSSCRSWRSRSAAPGRP